MPDHIQARNDDMHDDPKGPNRWVGKVVIFAILAGILGALVYFT